MRALLKLISACVASVLLYAAIFGLFIHKPLTVGIISDMLRFKVDYAAHAASPKLVVFAGSNARFSHRCEAIERLLSVPCVNFGISRGIGLDYLFSALEPTLRAGDIVYMPLEYEGYLDSKVQAMTGPDAALMLFSEKRKLLGLGAERSLRALFCCDLAYAVSGLAEIALERIGVRRRFSLDTLTAQGDERGHGPEKGQEYRAYIDSAPVEPPSIAAFEAASYNETLISGFLHRAKQHGVRVVGGLPTTFDDITIPAQVIADLEQLYRSEGQDFLVLDNRSQYPRNCFYDTSAHLNEPCQIAHSERLAAALAPWIARRGEIAAQAEIPDIPAGQEPGSLLAADVKAASSGADAVRALISDPTVGGPP